MPTSMFRPSFDPSQIRPMSCRRQSPAQNRHRAANAAAASPPFHLTDRTGYQIKATELSLLERTLSKSTADSEGLLIVLSHLHPSLVPTPSWQTFPAVRSIELANQSLHLLSTICSYCQEFAELARNIFPRWLGIWAWMQFFFSNAMERGANHPRRGSSALQCLEVIVLILASTPDLFPSVVDTPGVLEVFTHQYLVEDDVGAGGDRLAVQYYHLTKLPMSSESFQDILYATNGPKNLAHLLMRRLQSLLLRPRSADRNVAQLAAGLLTAFTVRTDPHMLEYMLAAGSTLVVIDCIRILNERPATVRSIDDMGTCYRLLIIACERSDNSRWLLKAVENGLMQTIVSTAKFMQCMPSPCGFKHPYDLIDRLFLRLCDRRVARAISIQVFPPHEKKIPGPPLEQKWKALLGVVGQRAASRIQGWQLLCQCSFCGDEPKGLKECSGCRDVRYCSNTCQKSHWKTHQQHCVQIHNHKDALRSGAMQYTATDLLSYRERMFLAAIGKAESIMNGHQFMALFAPFTTVDRDILLLRGDYSKTPAVFSVHISRDSSHPHWDKALPMNERGNVKAELSFVLGSRKIVIHMLLFIWALELRPE